MQVQSPFAASSLVRPANQVHFTNLARRSKRLPVPGLNNVHKVDHKRTFHFSFHISACLVCLFISSFSLSFSLSRHVPILLSIPFLSIDMSPQPHSYHPSLFANSAPLFLHYLCVVFLHTIASFTFLDVIPCHVVP
jgi:hypothetical protein